jgi:hypothetical protein
LTKTFLILTFLCVSLSLCAQKDFEGIIVYRNSVTSNIDGFSNNTWKKMLALSDTDTSMIKRGNFKMTTPRKEAYYITDKQKIFIRYKGIDTLYYIDYSSDTATVVSVNKTADKKRIAGYDCNSLTIQTLLGATKFYYPPAIYMNPAYNQTNKIDQYNVFAKETSSLFLESEQQMEAFTLRQTALRVQETAIDDNVFKLPDLPQKKFELSSFIIKPEFAGKDGWPKYLQSNLNPEVAAKYVKISRKEDIAVQQALVSFIVSESGTAFNVVVVNKKEVHPKLAEEAIRVVSGSRWRPATAFGEKIAYRMTQPITFQVTKQ